MSKQSDKSAEFNGECAFALSTGKKGVEGKHSCSIDKDGKTYLFSNSIAKFLWRILPSREEKAEATWTE